MTDHLRMLGVVAVVVVALVATTVASAMAFSGWAPAQAVAGLNTTSSDGRPIQSPDGLSFYLASNRTGTLGELGPRSRALALRLALRFAAQNGFTQPSGSRTDAARAWTSFEASA